MSTPAELLAQSLAKFQTANRIDGSKNSYRKDNPSEYTAVMAYLNGGARPNATSDMGLGLVLEEDARRALLVPEPVPPSGFAVDYKGMDYVGPEHDWTAGACGSYYNWLKPSCFPTTSARLQQDIDYIKLNNLGKFQRVWISLDHMFSSFNATTGFGGYDPQALANLHVGLAKFDAAGMRVALVAFANGNQNPFHFEALDGNHAVMLANYVEAMKQFVAAIAGNPVSSRAVAVVDFFNEAYYQAASRLAVGGVSWGTVEARVEVFLNQLYTAAKSVAPNLMYTVSDVGYLLDNQSAWVNRYPVDVYDIHCYDSVPWNNTAKYAKGLTLPKPWFAGEVGCGVDNVPCIYDTSGDSTQTLKIDKWWLDNLKLYGCKAVLIESRETLVIRSDPYQLRPVGAMLKSYA